MREELPRAILSAHPPEQTFRATHESLGSAPLAPARPGQDKRRMKNERLTSTPPKPASSKIRGCGALSKKFLSNEKSTRILFPAQAEITRHFAFTLPFFYDTM